MSFQINGMVAIAIEGNFLIFLALNKWKEGKLIFLFYRLYEMQFMFDIYFMNSHEYIQYDSN